MNAPAVLPRSLPKGLRSPRQLCTSAAAHIFAPEPEITVSAWADQKRRLSSKTSSEPGAWSTARTPYLREIMDALTPSHPCTDGAFLKGTQIGGSEAFYNAIGMIADLVPCPIMLVMPTTDTAKRVSKQRIQPMIEETPALSEKFSEAKSRDSSNTVQQKDFAGGSFVITGANSGPGLRNMPARILLQDEIDAYPDDVDGEGDPVAVADKRTDTYSRAKRFKCSSPKIKGKSRITRAFEAGTQGRFHVPCPNCKGEQWLKWGQMRWAFERHTELTCHACGGISEVDPAAGVHVCTHCAAPAGTEPDLRQVDTGELARVWYECEHCGHEINEHHKTWMLEAGRHIHAAPGAGEVLADDDPEPHAIWAMVRGQVRRFLPKWARPLSWHVSALYSPLGWFSWFKAVRQYLDSQKGGYDEESGESLEQVFTNTVLGEAYEVQGEQPKVNILKQRVELHSELGRVPAGGLVLFAGVDVQGDRLEVEVDAFGRGEECWTIDHQVIHGDPLKHGPGSVWDVLAQLRDKAYPHAGGQTLRVLAMAVDSGYLTQEVYDFARRYSHKHVFATKGQGETGKPILSRPVWVDVKHDGQKIKKGVRLWHVGTDTAKERFYKRLELQEPGPGYQHFPRGLPDEYFEQLASEKLVRRVVRGVEKHEWVKTRERNEALDLKILCYAAAIYGDLQRINWDVLERLINPGQADLFAVPAPAATSADATTPSAVSPAVPVALPSAHVWTPPPAARARTVRGARQ